MTSTPDHLRVPTTHGLVAWPKLALKQSPRWGRVVRVSHADVANIAGFLVWAADYIENDQTSDEPANYSERTLDCVDVMRNYAAALADAGMEARMRFDAASSADRTRRAAAAAT